jgi:hypothetical protein
MPMLKKTKVPWEGKEHGDPGVLSFKVPFGSVFISVLVRYFNFNLHKHRTALLLPPSCNQLSSVYTHLLPSA